MGRPLNPNVPEAGYKSKQQFEETGSIAQSDFAVVKDLDNSAKVVLDVSAVATGTTSTIKAPASGTVDLGTIATNPMTTGGDTIYGGASGVPTRLANGTSGQVLTSQGTTTAPHWTTVSGGLPSPEVASNNYTAHYWGQPANFVGVTTDSDQTNKAIGFGSTDSSSNTNSTSEVFIVAGDLTGTSPTGVPGDVQIAAGSVSNGGTVNGANVTIGAGSSYGGSGGNIILSAGAGVSSTRGTIQLTDNTVMTANLIPDTTDNNRDLGANSASDGQMWRTLYAKYLYGKTGGVNNPAAQVADLSTRTLNGAWSLDANLDANSHKIIDVTDPTGAQDAATKNYVDTVASQLNPIQGVYAATVGSNIAGTYANGASGIGATFTTTSTSTFTLDGVTPPLLSRILFKDQTAGAQDGVYTFTALPVNGVSGAVFTRTLDYDTATDMNAGDIVPVINGTLNGNTSWLQTTTIATVGTDSLTFVKWTANPANYLLKANNLSDVTTANTALNNLLPSQTSNAGKVLQTDGTNTSWQSSGGGFSPKFYTSAACTSNSSHITTTPFSTFSNSPTLTFTPTVTGTYKVYCTMAAIIGGDGSGGIELRVKGTAGSPTVLSESQCALYTGINGAFFMPASVQSTYTLTASTSYSFDIQAQSDNGGVYAEVTGGTAQFYIYAELVG